MLPWFYDHKDSKKKYMSGNSDPSIDDRAKLGGGAHLAGHEGLLDGTLAHALPAQLVLQLGQLRARVC